MASGTGIEFGALIDPHDALFEQPVDEGQHGSFARRSVNLVFLQQSLADMVERHRLFEQVPDSFSAFAQAEVVARRQICDDEFLFQVLGKQRLIPPDNGL
jgi:hypothetical protein